MPTGASTRAEDGIGSALQQAFAVERNFNSA